MSSISLVCMFPIKALLLHYFDETWKHEYIIFYPNLNTRWTYGIIVIQIKYSSSSTQDYSIPSLKPELFPQNQFRRDHFVYSATRAKFTPLRKRPRKSITHKSNSLENSRGWLSAVKNQTLLGCTQPGWYTASRARSCDMPALTGVQSKQHVAYLVTKNLQRSLRCLARTLPLFFSLLLSLFHFFISFLLMLRGKLAPARLDSY